MTSTSERARVSAGGESAGPKHWAREKYIPIRAAELVRRLAAQPTLAAEQRVAWEQLCRLLTATFHYQFHDTLKELKEAYAPFDPDCDTLARQTLSSADRQRRADELFDKFGWLLERANFVRLTRSDIKQALDATSDWGVRLSIDLDVFDRLEVYARGDVLSHKTRRRWRNLYRTESVDVPIFQRLVVIFRLHSYHTIDGHLDGETVHIKIFKNIPKVDLEMLLPGSRVKMSLFDQSKILLPTVSGVAMTGWKLFQGAVVVAVSGFYGLLTYLGLIAATLGYGVKSFFGYLRTQQKYQLSLTRNLYYQNLDNNAGVLFRLLDEAEEQECREAILAYFFLWHCAPSSGWSSERLDNEIEAFLTRETNVAIDFEVGDALDKLKRLGLVETGADGVLKAVPIEQALELLDRAWDNLFPYHQGDAAPAPGNTQRRDDPAAGLPAPHVGNAVPAP
ncbi:MAG TPA: TMEM143 family protein [Pirellulales bacterium]|nr:TMEM143 family protein [Pirellulales bacterium]